MSLLEDQNKEANAQRAEDNRLAGIARMAELAGIKPEVLLAKKFWETRKSQVERLRQEFLAAKQQKL